MRLVVPLLLALVLADPAQAQASIVPAEHPVYEWLLRQRVLGRLPAYRHEARPMDRATVVAHLDRLAGAVSGADRAWLRDVHRELTEPPEAVHSYVGDGDAEWADPDAVRYLAYERDEPWRIGAWGEGALEARAGGSDLRPGGLARTLRLTIDGGWRGRLGLYSSTVAGYHMTGDAGVLADDPDLAGQYYVARDPVRVAGPFGRTSASLRVRGGPFAAEIANQRLLLGPAAESPILLGDGADYVPHVRLGVHGRSVSAEFVHASLGSRSRRVLTDDGREASFDAPERFLAVHRLDVRPLEAFSFAFTEMVVYGRRGPELAYLNPLFPFNTGELALWDRDNTLFALEGTLRPVPGVEVSGTWLVDDIGFATFGDDDYGNKMGAQVGARLALPHLAASLYGEYLYLDPYLYTHRFQEDGVFFNSYTHNGFSLGHPLGPNADQWLVGAQAWLPGRVRARLSGRYVRKGWNPVDPVTGEVTQVGGDVALGTAPLDNRAAFLDGDVSRGVGVRGALVAEPHRAFALRVYGDVQFWDTRPTDVFLRLGLAVRP